MVHKKSFEKKPCQNLTKIFPYNKKLNSPNLIHFISSKTIRDRKKSVKIVLNALIERNSMQKSHQNRTVTNWNHLPQQIVSCSTVEGFKSKISESALIPIFYP